MTPTIPDGSTAIRDGIEVPTKNAFSYTKVEVRQYAHYLFAPKDNHDIIEPEIRTKYWKCNFDFSELPEYGTENYTQDLDKFAENISEKVDQRQEEFRNLKPRRKNKKKKDPLWFEMDLNFVHEELEHWGTLEERAEVMYEVGEFFIKKFTNQKEINNDYLMKPHFKNDPKRPGKLMPDLHVMLGYYDYDGNPINENDMYLRLGDIHVEAEKKFKFLLKTRQNAWEEQGKKKTVEEIKPTTDLINEIINKHKNKPSLIHEEFIKHGLKLTPKRKNTKAKPMDYVTIRYKGETIRTTADNFDKDTKLALFKYFEQKEFEDKYPKLKDAPYGSYYKVHETLTSIFDRFKGQPIEKVASALLSKGIILQPSFNNGKIKGFSLVLPRTDGKDNKAVEKASTFDFKLSDYTYTDAALKNIDHMAKDFMNKNYIALKDNETIVINGKHFKKDPITGELVEVIKSSSDKRNDFVAWMKWLKNDNESLPEFQSRMILSKNNKQSFLKTAFFKDGDYKIAYNTFNNMKMFKVNEDNSITIYQNNVSSIKSSLQAYAAINSLTEQEKKAGFKPAIIFKGAKDGQNRMRDQMWLQARLLGYVVTNYTPSPDIAKEYDNKLNERLKKDRQANLIRLKKYAAMSQSERSGQKVTLSYYKALENDVDRRAIAVACVDAFKLGLDLDVVLNPPKMHPDDRRKLMEWELKDKDTYNMMLELMKKEAPEKYDDFVKALEKAKAGSGSPGDDESKNTRKPTYKTKPKT